MPSSPDQLRSQDRTPLPLCRTVSALRSAYESRPTPHTSMCVIPQSETRLLFRLFPQLGEDSVVLEGGGVADLFLAFGDVPEEAAHDFPAAGLGQRARE